MKTIIAGSRTITNQKLINKIISSCDWKITEVICGCAPGVDTLGEVWAREHNVHIEYYPADWNKYGKAAGHIRNEQMAENAEALIVVWDGKSPGSKNMLKNARRKNLRIFKYVVNDDDDKDIDVY